MKYTLIVLVVIIVIYYYNNRESFATKRDKATAIYNWFSINKSPLYTNYKRDFNGSSNIVEYEDVLDLSQKSNLTVDGIEKII